MSDTQSIEKHFYDDVTSGYIATNNSTLRILLRNMSILQLRYIAERSKHTTNAACALALGISPNTIRSWSNKKEVKLAVEMLGINMVMVARAMIAKASTDAAVVVIDMLDDSIDDDAALRLKAAQDILNRSGIVPPSRTESLRLSHSIIEHRHIDELSDAALEAMLPMEGLVIEGDIEE